MTGLESLPDKEIIAILSEVTEWRQKERDDAERYKKYGWLDLFNISANESNFWNEEVELYQAEAVKRGLITLDN